MSETIEIVKLIQRKGLKADLPVLDEGEFGFATDSGQEQLYIGSARGNILIAKKSDIPKDSGSGGSTVTDSTNNGYINVDGVELQVYDDRALQQAIEGKANNEHDHDLSDLTGLDVTNKANGYALLYDSTLGKFVSKALPSGSGSGATSLDGLSDVDLTTVTPLEGNALVFEAGIWKPKDIEAPMTSHKGLTYVIELDRWGIRKDGTNPDATAKGLDYAVQWAKDNGYSKAFLPSGHYLVRLQLNSRSSSGTTPHVVKMPDDFHFELDRNALIEVETNSWTNYDVVLFNNAINSRVSGGKIKGDRKTHKFEIYTSFVRGGINPDGTLNDDPNWIRTPILDRLSEGILSMFRVWLPDKLPNATGYHFAQWKDVISPNSLAGYRNNGLFAPNAPTGRGWFAEPDLANKMIIAIDITNNPLTDEEVSNLRIKLDHQYFTHESGYGVAIYGGYNVEVDHMELFDFTGDGVLTGTGYKYQADGNYPDLVKLQREIGQYIYIHHNDIHRNRRQGVSLCGPNDQYVYENHIHHIGKDDDGVTPHFTAPAFGIDIESMVGESNIPYKHLYYGYDGVEVNFRINVFNNYVHHNERGHFVSPDGSYVTVENNIFEGAGLGGVSADYRYRFNKFINNTYIGCEQWVSGDNLIQGGTFDKGGNIRLATTEGAIVRDVKIKDGIFYGNSKYGFFGTPTVDVTTSSFIFSAPHEMGNTAKVSFESWAGKVPKGLQTNKVYYVVNQQAYSFQVSETEGGKPVVFYDSGEQGFIVSRYNYGRLYIDGVTIEKDYRSSVKGIDIALSGATLKNIVVKNCNVTITGSAYNYSGRPITIEGLTVIDSEAQLNNCQVSNAKFISSHGDSVSLGTDNNYNKYYGVNISDATFLNQTVYLGDVNIRNSRFTKSALTKENNNHKSIVMDSYIENSKVATVWASQPKVLLVTGCSTYKMTTSTSGSDPNALQLIGNTDIATSVVDKTPVQISVTPEPYIYNTKQTVNLTCAIASSIRYTLDGTEPTAASTLYINPIVVESPTVIKAIALDSNSSVISKKTWFYDVDLIAPEDVTSLLATDIKNSSVTLTWEHSIATDWVKYEVYNEGTLLKTTSEASVYIDRFLANTTYTLTVVTVDDAGNKSDGLSVTFTTSDDEIPPEEVTLINASLISDTNIGLTWEPSIAEDIYSYEVYNGLTLIGESLSPNFSITNLIPSTEYTFTIKSKDKNGNVSTGVPFTVSTSSTPPNSFIGYVKDGLITFMTDVLAGTTLLNKNSYFVGNEDFTVTFLTKANTKTSLIERRVLGQVNNSTLAISSANWGTSSAYVQAVFTGKNQIDGTYKNYPPISTNDSDMQGKMEPDAYYMITIRRSGDNIRIYLNGTDYTILAPVSSMSLDTNYRYLNGDGTTSLTIGDSSHTSNSHYKVFAYYNRALTSDEIAQNFQSLFDLVVPLPVSDFSAISTVTGIANLSWTDSKDKDTLYKNAYYKKTADSTWTKANASRITEQSYQITGLTSGISYDFKIEIVDNHLNKTSTNLITTSIL
ncbi:chitobiase/beta-hexosaminidase C-terminal domain-containing protein [Cytobacillus kochii]|uniref:fibronectin type III domain-containing protein n=1 Tax=Cytobacillus kochii TaxID=859143 RepID=UPI001CD373CC|nr:chitobiase/beta-hexosaminidase C-terminal domain-containing protein [Cytobacillus kochii]MCA1025654.1 chitobiase/beta-hexosaminidase C-terminal domain-containing protein [Cytobacillus kochii]